MRSNGGVVMVNFFSGYLLGDSAGAGIVAVGAAAAAGAVSQ
jgi:hypothetical protein